MTTTTKTEVTLEFHGRGDFGDIFSMSTPNYKVELIMRSGTSSHPRTQRQKSVTVVVRSIKRREWAAYSYGCEGDAQMAGNKNDFNSIQDALDRYSGSGAPGQLGEIADAIEYASDANLVSAPLWI